MSLTDAQYDAMATLLDSMRAEVRQLRGLFRVSVAGLICELPMSHTWQPIPGVPGVEMSSLDPADWPADAIPGCDYHLLRGPGGSHSPGVLRVPQALRLEIFTGHAQYWKEGIPAYVDYYPGDIFTCTANEGHQWEAYDAFSSRVSFSPALIPRPEPADEEPSGCSVTPDLV